MTTSEFKLKYKIDKLFGEEDIINYELYMNNENELNNLEKIYEIIFYLSFWGKNFKEFFNFQYYHNKEQRVRKEEYNILFYYLVQQANDLIKIFENKENLDFYRSDIILVINTRLSKIIKLHFLERIRLPERKYKSEEFFNKINLLFKVLPFPEATHISKGLITEYYQDIIYSNLDCDTKSNLINEMLENYTKYYIDNYDMVMDFIDNFKPGLELYCPTLLHKNNQIEIYLNWLNSKTNELPDDLLKNSPDSKNYELDMNLKYHIRMPPPLKIKNEK